MNRGAGLFVLFTSAVLYWIGFSMLRPMVALYFDSAGYSMTVIGLLMALHAFVPVIFAMPAGGLIDRIGTRKSVLAGSMILILSGSLYWLGGSLGMILPIIVAQVLNGLGSLLSWGALQAGAALSSRKMEGKKSDHLLANFAFVNSIAQFAGPLLGGVISDVAGYTTVFMIFAIMAVVSVAFSFLLPSIKKQQNKVKEMSFNILKSYGNGVKLMKDNKPFSIAIFVNGVTFILIDINGTFFPIYLVNQGLTNTQVGMMLSIGGVAAILIRPFVGLIIGRLGHEKTMLTCIIVGAGCLISLIFQPSFWILPLIVFMWGMCSGVNQPMALIMVARTVHASQQGMGMSLRTMSNRLVQVTNPVMFGALTSVVGLTWGFGVVGFMLLGFAGYARYLFDKYRVQETSDATLETEEAMEADQNNVLQSETNEKVLSESKPLYEPDVKEKVTM